jgi:hypothetical protein
MLGKALLDKWIGKFGFDSPRQPQLASQHDSRVFAHPGSPVLRHFALAPMQWGSLPELLAVTYHGHEILKTFLQPYLGSISE